ncbi:MAG: GGDEF domain-containing protein, partial [Cyanobacteria bacterium P01_A01_bin.17]
IYKAIAFKEPPYECGRRETRLEFDSPHFGGPSWFDQIVQYVAPGEIVIGATNCTTDVERQRQLERLVEFDSLTGAYSRHATLNRLREECGRIQNRGGLLGLLMLDIDDFKFINDHCGGHTVGDRVLKEICVRIQTHLRNSIDRLGRMGGDEFLILIPGANLQDTISVGNRILQVAHQPFDPKFTVSIGAIEVSKIEGLTADDLHDVSLKRVDDALYKAKDLGRARVSS